MTINHNYKTPQQGDSDWHLPLNENFKQHDIDIEVRDHTQNLGNYEPQNGAKFYATDTGDIYLGDGSQWLPVPSSGPAPTLQSVNGDQYASAYPGATLSERLQNALDALRGGQGTVYITARPDGQPWQWGDDLTIDPMQYNGVEIVAGHSVRIEYDGDGTMLTFDSFGTHQGDAYQVRFVGGQWISTGNPDGWLRLKDIILSEIHPHQVDFTSTSKDSCFGVSVENHDLYSEANRIGGDYRSPVGITFTPASETGGSGTDSFHDTVIDHAHINASNVGVRLAGVFQMCELRKVALFGTGTGADLMVLDSRRTDGTVISATKWESPGNHGDVTAVVTGSRYDGWYGPTVIGGYFGYGVTTKHRDDGAKKPYVMRILSRANAFRVESVHTGERVDITEQGKVVVDNGIETGEPTHYNPKDIRDTPFPDEGLIGYHDGSGSNTTGPAFYDGSNWISLVDQTTIS